MGSHEPLHSHKVIVAGSNLTFGLSLAGVFLLHALWLFISQGYPPRWWEIIVALVLALLAFVAPDWLKPLNHLWFRIGLALNWLVSPVIMGLLFYGIVSPMGIVMRALGNDILSLQRNDNYSYWNIRKPVGPLAGSMKNQF